MNKEQVLSLINEKITENTSGAITATVLNEVLTAMMNVEQEQQYSITSSSGWTFAPGMTRNIEIVINPLLTTTFNHNEQNRALSLSINGIECYANGGTFFEDFKGQNYSTNDAMIGIDFNENGTKMNIASDYDTPYTITSFVLDGHEYILK